MGLFQFRLEAFVLAPMKLQVGVAQEDPLRPCDLASDHVIELRKPGVLVEPHEVRFDLARPHRWMPVSRTR